MTAGVTVFGLVEGGHVLEDIRTNVPYHTEIQIPAHLVERSQNLVEALQQMRLLKLGNTSLVVKPMSSINPMLRGRGIALALPAPVPKSDLPPAQWAQERAGLVRELEASRAECARQQALNGALQAALVSSTGQLDQIQKTLDTLAQGRSSATLGAVQFQTQVPSRVAGSLDSSVRHFIPATNGEAAEVRINLPETLSTSNLDEARAALRSLRGQTA